MVDNVQDTCLLRAVFAERRVGALELPSVVESLGEGLLQQRHGALEAGVIVLIAPPTPAPGPVLWADGAEVIGHHGGAVGVAAHGVQRGHEPIPRRGGEYVVQGRVEGGLGLVYADGVALMRSAPSEVRKVSR